MRTDMHNSSARMWGSNRWWYLLDINPDNPPGEAPTPTRLRGPRYRRVRMRMSASVMRLRHSGALCKAPGISVGLAQ
jgi:hypothetical protein